ncbi:M48 family metallopeptidase [Planctomicrobium sp. SH527]|uniref:M48 family metallopeptidase n=1 Tax=Planctomicrobium sp. SH527 TaxID=3448123 RepID=UPI003F5B90CB
MLRQFQLGETQVNVEFKDIKNVHLSVHPPEGKVRIAAPRKMKLETVRLFAVAKLDWIRRKQKEILSQERESVREYLDRESHYVWGKRYLLSVSVRQAPPELSIKHNKLYLGIRPDTSVPKRQAIIEKWYRDQLKQAIPDLITKWEPILGVRASGFYVQRMRTRWGSCNPNSGTIRLNTELAKKPRECLEYVVVHELVHLLEPTHNARFVALMDQLMPQWQETRKRLNRLPIPESPNSASKCSSDEL